MSDETVDSMSAEQVLTVATALATCVKWRRIADLQLLLRAIQSGQVGGPLTDWLVDCGWAAGGMSDVYEAANFVFAKRFSSRPSMTLPDCLLLTNSVRSFLSSHLDGASQASSINVESTVLAAFDTKNCCTPARLYRLLEDRTIPASQVWRFLATAHTNPEMLRLDTSSVNVFAVRRRDDTDIDRIILLHNNFQSGGWGARCIDAAQPAFISEFLPGNGRTRLIFPCSPRAIVS